MRKVSAIYSFEDGVTMIVEDQYSVLKWHGKPTVLIPKKTIFQIGKLKG